MARGSERCGSEPLLRGRRNAIMGMRNEAKAGWSLRTASLFGGTNDPDEQLCEPNCGFAPPVRRGLPRWCCTERFRDRCDSGGFTRRTFWFEVRCRACRLVEHHEGTRWGCRELRDEASVAWSLRCWVSYPMGSAECAIDAIRAAVPVLCGHRSVRWFCGPRCYNGPRWSVTAARRGCALTHLVSHSGDEP